MFFRKIEMGADHQGRTSRLVLSWDFEILRHHSVKSTFNNEHNINKNILSNTNILNRETNKETRTENNMSHPTLYGVLDAEKKQTQLHQAALLAQVNSLPFTKHPSPI